MKNCWSGGTLQGQAGSWGGGCRAWAWASCEEEVRRDSRKCSGRQKRRTWPVNRVSNTLRVISKEAGAKGCRGAQGEWQSRQRAVFKAWFGPLHSL